VPAEGGKRNGLREGGGQKRRKKFKYFITPKSLINTKANSTGTRQVNLQSEKGSSKGEGEGGEEKECLGLSSISFAGKRKVRKKSIYKMKKSEGSEDSKQAPSKCKFFRYCRDKDNPDSSTKGKENGGGG